MGEGEGGGKKRHISISCDLIGIVGRRTIPSYLRYCLLASNKSVPRHTCTFLTVAEREHMRITGLDETIAINVIKICCAINYQTFDNFLFLFLFLLSYIWLPLLDS